jgi:hypothetical protein
MQASERARKKKIKLNKKGGRREGSLRKIVKSMEEN